MVTTLLLSLMLCAAPDAGVAASLKPVRPSASGRPGLAPVPVEPTAPEFRWDIPGVIDSVPVSGALESLGTPVRAHAVVSKEKPEALYRSIAQSFVKADLYIPPPKYQFHVEGMVSLTALDDERMISYTAIFQPNPDGTTTVILGEANIGQRREETPGASVPLIPGAGSVLTSRSEGAVTTTFEITGSAVDARAYYQQVLPSLGFRETESGAFEKDGTLVEVRVVERGGTSTVAVVERSRSVEAPPQPRRDRAKKTP